MEWIGTRRVVVGSPKYLANRKRLRRLKDLQLHSLIHFTSLGPLPNWHFFRDGEEERVAIQPSFRTNSADAAIAHAERGGGLAMVLGYQVADSVRSGRLQVVLPKHDPPPLPIQVVHPASRLPSAGLKAFVELVVTTRDWNFVALWACGSPAR